MELKKWIFDFDIYDDEYLVVFAENLEEALKIVNLEEVNRLIDKVTLNVGKTANYKLRVWLNFDGLTDTEKEALVGQKIFLTLKINGIQNVILDNLDTSGASVPVLASNMIPVYYDGTTYSGVAYPESKYYNSYTNTGTYSSPVTNYTNDMQHALTETKNWYSDFADFVNSNTPWFVRGGVYDNSGGAGVFSNGSLIGNAVSGSSVRLVITNE